MWTETYAQIMDRAIIERLKEEMFRKVGNIVQSASAGRQANELETAADAYVTDVLNGDVKHVPHQHLRFHDHGVDEPVPASVEECLNELRSVHRRYWDTQSRVQKLKLLLVEKAGHERAQILEEFHSLQLRIDRCNQRRNEVRTQCDLQLSVELDERRKKARRSSESSEASETRGYPFSD